jgi:hypothetical protein
MLGEGPKQPETKARVRDIMGVAGELDDRWPGTRKRTGREESPDTTLREQRRAMRLVTPGER